MPKRILLGQVVSDRNDKSVVVSVELRFKHPLMGKIVRRTKRYQAHDENNEWKVGDRVRIEECRPVSKTKSWRVVGGEHSETV